MFDGNRSTALRARSPRFPSSKFCPSTVSSNLIRRSRLLDELERKPLARLTLVVGSPGAGKSALLVDWRAAHPERPWAWLNCDPADTDSVRFAAAIVEAIRRSGDRSELGEDALQLLSVDGEVSADVIAALANDLEELGGADVLVIDDLHLAGTTGVETLDLLLQYKPRAFRLVVASRVDPSLRLHRMRANDELVELRDRDLCFSVDEAGVLLSGFGVRLTEETLSLVYERSEGWIAGLQMAAISMRDSSDPLSAADRLELRPHTVAGYFLDEVLYRQSPEVVEFMLATSILDDLSVPACSALCGAGAAERLEWLYSNHLFTMRVGGEPGTYRYHQLIRDVLRAELHFRDPGGERRLHERAAKYLTDVGQVGPAVQHLLAFGDADAAFALLREGVLLDFVSSPTMGSALDAADVRPELFAGAPTVLVPLATDLQVRGAFERSSRALALAEQSGIDAAEDPELAIQLAMVRMIHLALTGQLEAALGQRHWARATSSLAPDLDLWLLGMDITAMHCCTYLGDLDEARRLAEVVASAQAIPSVTEVLCPGALSEIAWAEGVLTAADAMAGAALESAGRLGFERHYFAFHGLRAAALLALERRDLATASALIERALEMVSGGRPAFEYLAQLARACVWAADGRVEEALTSLPLARRALQTNESVLFAQVDELEARFRLALGDGNSARSWAEKLPNNRKAVVSAIIALAADDPGNAAAASALAPSPGATVRADLELRLLRASVAIVRARPEAPRLVSEVLRVIERYGYVQTVLDTAPQVADHLVENPHRYPSTENLRRLITARLETRRPSASPANSGGLPDPLTDAEQRILATLPERLTYADMAAELHLSLNTVKTHLRHTYMKLQVNSRTAAVQRATALGLI
jgi:LuxR family transcriptional regulator, maltose regulon positive regulatory protein